MVTIGNRCLMCMILTAIIAHVQKDSSGLHAPHRSQMACEETLNSGGICEGREHALHPLDLAGMRRRGGHNLVGSGDLFLR